METTIDRELNNQSSYNNIKFWLCYQ